MTPEISQLYSLIVADGPRHETDDGLTEPGEKLTRRTIFRNIYGYAIPTRAAILDIINFASGPIVEIMAGRGLWASLIKLEGGDITATDYVPISKNRYLVDGSTWTEVTTVDAREAARTAPVNSTLLVIWPPYLEDAAGEALAQFRGDKFVFVGERDRGCTGGDNLFAELRANWVLDHEFEIPRWYGIFDSVFCYTRKTRN